MKKILLTATVALASLVASAQCSDLFFSEYLEGTSNNKAIEIYNPTSVAINLNDYVIYRYNNGSPTPSDSLFPQDILAPGDVWVAGNPSAIAAILSESDTLHTITFFNGDDAMSLKKISTGVILDVIGLIGNDPGTNWPVGSGATSEFTLVRMIGFQQGNTNWSTAANEYDVYAQNTVSFLGSHSMTPCCIAPPPLFLVVSVPNMCFGDANASITVDAPGVGITYSWVGRPETTTTITGLTAGTYSAVATNGCGSDTLIAVVSDPPLLTSMPGHNDVTCFGMANGTAGVLIGGGTNPYTYSWSPSGGTNSSASNLAPGTYSVTTTDANGCSLTETITITEPFALNSAIVSQTNPTCNGNTNGSLTVFADGGTPGYTYVWSSNGTGVTETGLGDGLYTVTITDLNGCTTTTSAMLTEPAALNVTFAFSMDTLCSNDPGSYALIGSPAGGTWSGTGVTGTDFFPAAANIGVNYVTYMYTDSIGCTANATDSIAVDICFSVAENAATQFDVYPNPFSNQLTVVLNSAAEKTISLYDLQGQLVYSEVTIQSTLRISTAHLSAGMYFLQVSDGTNTSVQKIQKSE